MNSMAGKVFIIGNGFDLDLGIPTRYSDFFSIWESNNLWPFDDSSTNLGGYIHRLAKTYNWLDLEMALYQYAAADNGYAKKTPSGNYPIESDRNDFKVLVNRLSLFINLSFASDLSGWL